MGRPLVPIAEARRFMIDCFKAVKVPIKNAESMTEALVEADYRGYSSHGMNRLEMYINSLLNKTLDGAAMPTVLRETSATAWVDGKNGLGPVVGNFSMDLAIEKAKNVGVGVAIAMRSNHYGIASFYPLRAIKEDMIGISMTNGSPLVVPTRGKHAALGTNPIAFAAPGKSDVFIMDIASSMAALGKIEIHRRKNEPLPSLDWAQGPDGKPINDPELAFKTACLIPLGGQTAGHKGYALAAMVDILCGVISGSNYSTLIRPWNLQGAVKERNIGHFFMAIDPKRFAPNFAQRLAHFNCILRCVEPTDPKYPVLVPGDVEREKMCEHFKSGQFNFSESQWQTCDKLAKELKIRPLCEGS